jgi:uncharacterized protein
MRMSRVHRWTDAVEQPWKNGGGVTRELLREPAHGPFDLRLSVATVASDGPFSKFPGIDRVITLLEGNGFALRSGERRVEIREVGAPFAFSGEDSWDCALLDGPVLDFNLMVPRGRAARVARVDGAVDLGARGFLLALRPMGVGGHALQRFDLLQSSGVHAGITAGAALGITLDFDGPPSGGDPSGG